MNGAQSKDRRRGGGRNGTPGPERRWNLLAGPAGILLIWTLLHTLLGGRLIPSPWATAAVLAQLAAGPELWLHIGASLYRIIAGIALALLAGIPLGLAAGLRRSADRLLSPLLYLLYPLPKIAFLPVFMLLFGLGDLSKIILIWTIIVFQLVIAARDGVKEIPESLFRAMQTLGVKRRQFYRDLIIPSILPKLISALRVSLGISISVLFFGENFSTTWGIGYFVMNSWIMVNYTQMFAGITAIGLMGIALFRFLDFSERLLCPWRFLGEQ
jgi:NitT/TauT family transport system permease protein